jgi:hypothetical protein
VPSKLKFEDGPCKHCAKRKICRARGLCFVCSRTPEIRVRYAPKGRAEGWYGGETRASGRLPAEPTHHPPGSEGKIAVMAERAARGESCFHPQDARNAPGAEG